MKSRIRYFAALIIGMILINPIINDGFHTWFNNFSIAFFDTINVLTNNIIYLIALVVLIVTIGVISYRLAEPDDYDFGRYTPHYVSHDAHFKKSIEEHQAELDNIKDVWDMFD